MRSFVESTHGRHWIVRSTNGSNAEDRTLLSPEDIFQIKMNYIKLLMALGKQLGLRQTVTCTAMTYFWRFYLGNSFSTYLHGQPLPYCHPDYVAPTCLSLACKVRSGIREQLFVLVLPSFFLFIFVGGGMPTAWSGHFEQRANCGAKAQQEPAFRLLY
jgi:hypothetical protein